MKYNKHQHTSSNILECTGMQETTIVAFFEVSNCFNFRNACMKAHIRFQSFGKRESFAEHEGILESGKNL